MKPSRSDHDQAIASLCRMCRDLAQDFQVIIPPLSSTEHYVGSGRLLGDILSGYHMMPYLHDLTIFSDPGLYRHVLGRAIRAALESADERRRIHRVLRQLAGILALYPPRIEGSVAKLRLLVSAYLKAHRIRPSWVEGKSELPDIRDHFDTCTPTSRSGRYQIQRAWGRLGCPGKVWNPGKSSKMAWHTGDDAGHLIGGQFGAPGWESNLTLQNRLQNRGGGTYSMLETEWKRLLLDGVGVWACVSAYTHPNDSRPVFRHVVCELLYPNGTRKRETNLYYANTHTPESFAKHAALDEPEPSLR